MKSLARGRRQRQRTPGPCLGLLRIDSGSSASVRRIDGRPLRSTVGHGGRQSTAIDVVMAATVGQTTDLAGRKRRGASAPAGISAARPLPFEGEFHRSGDPRRPRPPGAAARVRHGPDRRGADRGGAVLGALGRGDRRARRAGHHPGGPRHRYRAGDRGVDRARGRCSGPACWPTNSGTAWPPGCSACRWSGVRLYLLGGVSELARAPRSPREEAIIAAAGPAVSAVLAGRVLAGRAAATRPAPSSWLLLMLLALSNLVVAVFNLLPALPLDGGRVLRAGVWRASGNRGAGTTAAVVGGYVIAVAAGRLGGADGRSMPGRPGCCRPGSRWRWRCSSPSARPPSGSGQAHGAAGPLMCPSHRWPGRWRMLPTETPVGPGTGCGRATARVILTEADGVARGMLDVPAARELAERDPRAPASLVARPLATGDDRACR